MMASASNDNFVSCYTAIETVLYQVRPYLQHALETWHQQTKKNIQPCLSPDQCPQNKKPTADIGACQGCLEWVAAIKDVVYPPDTRLYWSNVNPTLFSKDLMEITKLFIPSHPVNHNYSNLGELDNASVITIMSKLVVFHHGQELVIQNIRKVNSTLLKEDRYYYIDLENVFFVVFVSFCFRYSWLICV